jgi:hypothetical protein
LDRDSTGENVIMENLQILFDIAMKRYNFVVDLLDDDQQKILHQWYVDTGVIREEE